MDCRNLGGNVSLVPPCKVSAPGRVVGTFLDLSNQSSAIKPIQTNINMKLVAKCENFGILEPWEVQEAQLGKLQQTQWPGPILATSSPAQGLSFQLLDSGCRPGNESQDYMNMWLFLKS